MIVFQGNEYLQTVARCLQMMLRIDEYRLAFVEVDGISTYVILRLFILHHIVLHQVILHQVILDYIIH